MQVMIWYAVGFLNENFILYMFFKLTQVFF